MSVYVDVETFLSRCSDLKSDVSSPFSTATNNSEPLFSHTQPLQSMLCHSLLRDVVYVQFYYVTGD